MAAGTIEVQIRFPTTKGMWRWYEHADPDSDLSELLRRVVKHDVHEGSTVRDSETLWLNAYELLVKVVARYDAEAECFRPVRNHVQTGGSRDERDGHGGDGCSDREHGDWNCNRWHGCYDRRERLAALEDERAFLYRRFLNAKRESKVGYSESDRAAGAKEMAELQRQLDTLASKVAAIQAEDPRNVKPPLFPARTLTELGITDKCILFCIHRGVVAHANEGYLLPDLEDLRKASMDALRNIVADTNLSSDVALLEATLDDCLSMGMNKKEALSIKAFDLLKRARKKRDDRLEAAEAQEALRELEAFEAQDISGVQGATT
eukprot:INCI14962.1.p1 GENE.INCI14962.1~~INCI14962.1.p1  ORF type:complete len:320 (+),score=55.42 INCI14962.1:95-1054(+)